MAEGKHTGWTRTLSQYQTPVVWKIYSFRAYRTCSFDSAKASMTPPLTFRFSPFLLLLPVPHLCSRSNSNGVCISEEASRTSKCPETRLDSRDEIFEVVSALCYSSSGLPRGGWTYGRAFFLRSLTVRKYRHPLMLHWCVTR